MDEYLREKIGLGFYKKAAYLFEVSKRINFEENFGCSVDLGKVVEEIFELVKVGDAVFLGDYDISTEELEGLRYFV